MFGGYLPLIFAAGAEDKLQNSKAPKINLMVSRAFVHRVRHSTSVNFEAATGPSDKR